MRHRLISFVLPLVATFGCAELLAPISTLAPGCETRADCDEGRVCYVPAESPDSPGICLNSSQPVCGDGQIRDDLEPGEAGFEECDDSNTVSGDGCSSDCLTERCGNTRLDEGEECDDGNADNLDPCTNDCRFARCGDGIRRSEEACDESCRPGRHCRIVVALLADSETHEKLMPPKRQHAPNFVAQLLP